MCTDQPECGEVFACLTATELSAACEGDNPQACELVEQRMSKEALPDFFFRTERRAAARQCVRLLTAQSCLTFTHSGAYVVLPTMRVSAPEMVVSDERRAMEVVCVNKGRRTSSPLALDMETRRTV